MTLKLLPLICCLFCCLAVKSQQPTSKDSLPPTADSSNKIFTRVEKEAEFPGGVESWRKYLQNKLDPMVPVRNNAPAGRYDVVAVFIVSKDGSLSGIKARTSFGYGMEDELIRIIKKGPKWMPAMQNGIPVNSYRVQRISFTVSSSN
jgi:protein TonB